MEIDDKMIRQKLSELAEGVKHQTGGDVRKSSWKQVKLQKKLWTNETNSDIIILGTHGVSGFEEFFMGSNAFRVVTEAQCPVMSVQVHSTKVGFNDIVLPIDNSPASRQKVRFAVELAKHYDSKIHIAGILTLNYKDIRQSLWPNLSKLKNTLLSMAFPTRLKLWKAKTLPA